MKEGWTYKKLVDECSILYGYPFDSKCFSTSPDDMPLIRIRDVKEGKTSTFYNGDYPKDYIIHKGDYLIGMDGEFNISPWQSKDALLNQRVCKISCNTSSLLIRYVYRFLIKELKKIEDETPFVTVKHLSAKKINQINIPVPSIAEQEQIVAELDLLQGISEKKKEQLKAYNQLAQSIFYTMFGDPVTNEKGWDVIQLGSKCEVSSFKRVLIEDVVDKGIPFIRGTELMSLSKGEKTPFTLFITPEHYEKVKAISGVPKIGDLLIPSINANGSIWVLNTEEPRYYKDGRVLWVHVDNNTYTSQALKYIMHNLIMSNYSSVASGATFAELKLFVLRELNTIQPPLSLQQEFAEKVEAIERQKALVQQSIDETQTMFDCTMDKYFG